MLRPSRVPAILVLWSAVGAACTPEGPAPVLVGVAPDWGFSGADTEVLIDGRQFLPRLEAQGAQDISVDGQFSVVLETNPPTPLSGVERHSDTTLAATVPAGIDPGRYPLRVTGPSGASGRLADAFTVTNTRAATIGVSIPAVRFDVGDYALVELQLRDLSGGDVPAPIEVEVQAVSATGDPSAIVFQSGLVGQVALEPGRIQGSLDSGGGADLYFTSTAVDDVALTIRGLDLNDHIEVSSPELRFEPASIKDVVIEVGTAPLVAGEPTEVRLQLLDADGNTTRGELLVATVQETCSPGASGFVDVVTINDALTLSDVVLTGATVDGGCPDNRIRLVGSVGSEVLVVETPPLDILPGDIARYAVTPVADAVVAGVEEQSVVVRAEDTWTNPVVGHSAALTVQDSIGGLAPAEGIGSAACGGFFNGQAVCSVVLERSGEAVTVSVEDTDGISGVSREFRVLAGPAEALDVTVPEGPIVAGDTVQVVTQAMDAFDNPAPLDDVGGASALSLSDSTGSLVCSARFDGPSDGLHFSICTITTADPAAVVTAEIAALDILATADPLEVHNADLDHVDVALGQTVFTAGEPLLYEVAAFDAYDNPYLVQATSSVQVADRDGELSASAVTLDALGQGTGTATLVRATEANRLVARALGSTVGESVEFVVEAAEHAAFSAEVGSSWLERDALVDVTVHATDIYGNPTPGIDTTVELTSTAGAADPVPGVAVEGGTALVTMSWDEAVLQDTIQVTGDTHTGESDAFDVLDLGCAVPPVADLTVASKTDLRLCLVAGQTSDVAISATGSSPGNAALSAYHLHTGAGTYSRSTTPSWTERWTGAGARQVSVVVADDDACADLATAQVWVGDSDGEPVGPVEVVLDDSTLTAGSSSFGSTTASLLAVDCAGDPASGGTLMVRADLGTLSSASSTLLSTGAGLSLVLDSAGEGDVLWSVMHDDVAAEATLHAGVLSGAAHGSATATVTGDARAPFVVDLFPVGPTTESWTTIELAFSEPLLASSVTTTAFSLTDPTGAAVDVEAVTLSADGLGVTVEPEVPVDGSLGIWSFAVSSTVRDDGGGNFLAGDWQGAPSSFSVDLGNVTHAAPAVTSCTPSATLFRPDGDDGSGDEADRIELQATSDSTPAWWWLEVAGADGEVVLWQPTPATSASETLEWDGRGVDGRVVTQGEYTVTLTALDANLSENTACSNIITVDHPIDAPESP